MGEHLEQELLTVKSMNNLFCTWSSNIFPLDIKYPVQGSSSNGKHPH